MNRLLQGDVGSGKTVVAAGAAYCVLESGYQVVFMAPTDILANQLATEMKKFLPKAKQELLTARTPKKKSVLKKIADGSANLIIGTHAVFQSGVEYYNLGLIIIDEQQRFGVEQRAELISKNPRAHLLIMSATPIPQTLATAIYGDLDVSVIRGLPPGRIPVKPYIVNSDYRQRLWAFIDKQVNEGGQVYVICPGVEENLETEAKAPIVYVKEYAENLKKALPDKIIDIVHGKSKTKDITMADFAEGKIQIIVATTVVEVGVDAPNATLIVVENAERFGLAQLHQLRGRVGRGTRASYAVFISDYKGVVLERLRVLEQTNDGFVVAEKDLELRGPGDLIGPKQHGIPEFKAADLSKDHDVLADAKRAADFCIENNIALF